MPDNRKMRIVAEFDKTKAQAAAEQLNKTVAGVGDAGKKAGAEAGAGIDKVTEAALRAQRVMDALGDLVTETGAAARTGAGGLGMLADEASRSADMLNRARQSNADYVREANRGKTSGGPNNPKRPDADKLNEQFYKQLNKDREDAQRRLDALIAKSQAAELTGLQRIEAQRKQALASLGLTEQLQRKINTHFDTLSSKAGGQQLQQVAGNIRNFIQNPLYAAGAAAEKVVLSFGVAGLAAGGAVVGFALAAKAIKGIADAQFLAVDAIEDMSAATGLSIRQIQIFNATAEYGHDRVSGLATAMRKMSEDFATGGEASAKVNAALQALGVTQHHTADGAIDLSRAVTEAFSALEKIKDPARFNLEAGNLLGARVANQLKPQIRDWTELNALAQQHAVIIDDRDRKAADAYHQSVTTLRLEWEKLKLVVITAPAVSSAGFLSKGFTELLAILNAYEAVQERQDHPERQPIPGLEAARKERQRVLGEVNDRRAAQAAVVRDAYVQEHGLNEERLKSLNVQLDITKKQIADQLILATAVTENAKADKVSQQAALAKASALQQTAKRQEHVIALTKLAASADKEAAAQAETALKARNAALNKEATGQRALELRLAEELRERQTRRDDEGGVHFTPNKRVQELGAQELAAERLVEERKADQEIRHIREKLLDDETSLQVEALRRQRGLEDSALRVREAAGHENQEAIQRDRLAVEIETLQQIEQLESSRIARQRDSKLADLAIHTAPALSVDDPAVRAQQQKQFAEQALAIDQEAEGQRKKGALDTSAAIAEARDAEHARRLANEREFRQQSREYAYSTSSDAARFELQQAEKSKALQLARLEEIKAQTLQQKLALEQAKLAIERNYIAVSTRLEQEQIDREHLHAVQELSEEARLKGISREQVDRRTAEIDARFNQQRAQREIVTDEQILAAQEAAIKNSTNVLIDENRKVFEGVRSDIDQIFDAVTSKSQSVWGAVGNVIKKELLGAFKEVIDSEIAATVTSLITGRPVSLQRSGGKLQPVLGAAASVLLPAAAPPRPAQAPAAPPAAPSAPLPAPAPPAAPRALEKPVAPPSPPPPPEQRYYAPEILQRGGPLFKPAEGGPDLNPALFGDSAPASMNFPETPVSALKGVPAPVRKVLTQASEARPFSSVEQPGLAGDITDLVRMPTKADLALAALTVLPVGKIAKGVAAGKFGSERGAISMGGAPPPPPPPPPARIVKVPGGRIEIDGGYVKAYHDLDGGDVSYTTDSAKDAKAFMGRVQGVQERMQASFTPYEQVPFDRAASDAMIAANTPAPPAFTPEQLAAQRRLPGWETHPMNPDRRAPATQPGTPERLAADYAAQQANRARLGLTTDEDRPGREWERNYQYPDGSENWTGNMRRAYRVLNPNGPPPPPAPRVWANQGGPEAYNRAVASEQAGLPPSRWTAPSTWVGSVGEWEGKVDRLRAQRQDAYYGASDSTRYSINAAETQARIPRADWVAPDTWQGSEAEWEAKVEALKAPPAPPPPVDPLAGLDANARKAARRAAQQARTTYQVAPEPSEGGYHVMAYDPTHTRGLRSTPEFVDRGLAMMEDTVEPPEGLTPKNLVGYAYLLPKPARGGFEAEGLFTEKGHQHLGIASGMYDQARAEGVNVMPSPYQTTAGSTFWNRYGRPQQTLLSIDELARPNQAARRAVASAQRAMRELTASEQKAELAASPFPGVRQAAARQAEQRRMAELAEQAYDSSMDAHGKPVPSSDAWQFMQGLKADLEKEDLPDAMPSAFRDAYRNYKRTREAWDARLGAADRAADDVGQGAGVDFDQWTEQFRAHNRAAAKYAETKRYMLLADRAYDASTDMRGKPGTVYDAWQFMQETKAKKGIDLPETVPDTFAMRYHARVENDTPVAERERQAVRDSEPPDVRLAREDREAAAELRDQNARQAAAREAEARQAAAVQQDEEMHFAALEAGLQRKEQFADLRAMPPGDFLHMVQREQQLAPQQDLAQPGQSKPEEPHSIERARSWAGQQSEVLAAYQQARGPEFATGEMRQIILRAVDENRAQEAAAAEKTPEQVRRFGPAFKPEPSPAARAIFGDDTIYQPQFVNRQLAPIDMPSGTDAATGPAFTYGYAEQAGRKLEQSHDWGSLGRNLLGAAWSFGPGLLSGFSGKGIAAKGTASDSSVSYEGGGTDASNYRPQLTYRGTADLPDGLPISSARPSFPLDGFAPPQPRGFTSPVFTGAHPGFFGRLLEQLGGTNGGGGGTPPFIGNDPGISGRDNPPVFGGILGGILNGGRTPQSPAGGAGGAGAAVSPLQNLLGMFGFGSGPKGTYGTGIPGVNGHPGIDTGTGFGAGLRALGKSDAAALGGGILLSDGISRGGTVGTVEDTAGGALVGFKYGGPIGAAVGAAAGLVTGVLRQTVLQTLAEQVKKRVRDEYHIDINRQTAEQIANIAKTQYGGSIAAALHSQQVQQMLSLYAQTTGQGLKYGVIGPQQANLAYEGGQLQQAGTYVNGTLLGFQSGLKSLNPFAGTIQSPKFDKYGQQPSQITLSLDSKSSAAFLQGQTVEAMGTSGGQQAVSDASLAAAASSYNRLQTLAAMQRPGTVIS